MRRAMMTNRPTAGPPFTIGNPAVDQADVPSSVVDMLYIPREGGAAPRSATVTSASVYCGAGGTGRFVTGSWDGTTFTVTAVTADLTTTVGLNTFTTSLSIPSGGYVGWWQHSGSVERALSGGSPLLFGGATPAPTPGATYTTLTASTSFYSIQGTGA